MHSFKFSGLFQILFLLINIFMFNITLVQVASGEHMPPSKYASDEIQNSMFLPMMKKALMGTQGADAETTQYLFSYYKIFCQPLVCYAPGRDGTIIRGAEFFSLPSGTTLAILEIFQPPPKKIETTPDEKILDTSLNPFMRVLESIIHKSFRFLQNMFNVY